MLAASFAQRDSTALMVFSIFVVGALLLSLWVTSGGSRTKDYYLGDRPTGPFGNGLALMSTVTFLASPGLVALSGYDGAFLLLAPVVGWVLVLLIAEPYHNVGRFTIGDSLASRLRPAPVHLATGVATLIIDMLYLILQLVGAGALAAPLLGMPGPGAKQVVIVALGILTILYATIGGMQAATLAQLAKAVVLLGGGIVLAVAMMPRFHWSITELLDSAAQHSGLGDRFLRPGSSSSTGGTGPFDAVSLELTSVCGIAGLPHLLMRLRSVYDGRAARVSVRWAASLSTFYYLLVGLLGFGAVALLGGGKIAGDNAAGSTAVRLLAEFLGGPVMVTVVACAAFATVLAVSAGVTLSAATSVAHDLYAVVVKRNTASQSRELAVARGAVVVFGLTATVLSVYGSHVRVSLLTGFTLALAASAVLPSLLYTMYWPRFTTRGAMWSIYGGLLSASLLMIFSPAVSGNPTALLPGMDFAVFPLRNPGLISIPIGFLLGWLGSILDGREPGGADYAWTEARVLTSSGTRYD